MSSGNIPCGASKVITSSAQISNTSGVLVGIFISSATSGTIKAWDSLTATGTVLFDTTAAATLTSPLFVPCNMAFGTGLFITIGGTISCAVVYT